MRTFLIIALFFIMMFIVFASNFLGSVDLTPNTPRAAQAAAPTSTLPLVITIQENPTTPSSNVAFVPVTGGCANPYTVQPSDWLSAIAIKCDTTLAAILQANPQIINANLIYPNELINLPNAGTSTTIPVPVTGGCANPYTVQPGDWLSTIAIHCDATLAGILQANPQISDPNLIYPNQLINLPNGVFVPVTGGCTNPYTIQPGDWLLKIAAKCDTTLAAILQANPQIINQNLIYPNQQLILTNASAAVSVPVTGLFPTIQSGSGLQVRASNFLPNIPVYIAIGQKNVAYTLVKSDVTDASGNLTTQITVPNAPDSRTPWVVVIETTSNPPIQIISQSFYIQ